MTQWGTVVWVEEENKKYEIIKSTVRLGSG